MSGFQQQLLQPPSRASIDGGIQAPSRIVEFVVPEISPQQLAFIFPLLGHLSFNEDPRWVTCIGSLLLSKRDCRQFGLNRYRLLQVLPSHRCNVVDITERALAAGKSHTVFCQVKQLSDGELARLELAAALGQARCIIVRSR